MWKSRILDSKNLLNFLNKQEIKPGNFIILPAKSGEGDWGHLAPGDEADINLIYYDAGLARD